MVFLLLALFHKENEENDERKLVIETYNYKTKERLELEEKAFVQQLTKIFNKTPKIKEKDGVTTYSFPYDYSTSVDNNKLKIYLTYLKIPNSKKFEFIEHDVEGEPKKKVKRKGKKK